MVASIPKITKWTERKNGKKKKMTKLRTEIMTKQQNNK